MAVDVFKATRGQLAAITMRCAPVWSAISAWRRWAVRIRRLVRRQTRTPLLELPLVRTEGKAFLRGPTLSPDRFVELPLLSRASKSEETREVERCFGLGDSLYFFVGHACPNFGDLVLIYEPTLAETGCGGATPFDTGGLYCGKVHADVALTLSERTLYCASHAITLAELPNAVCDYLQRHFSSPTSYVRGHSPTTDDLSGRLRHAANSRRAWTWEVRLWRDHPIRDSLRRIWMSADYAASVRDFVTNASPGSATDCEELLHSGVVRSVPSGQMPHGHAEQEIAAWL